MSEEERYRRAKEQVERLRGFYSHLVVYVIVNTGLLILNMVASPKNLWFYWPLLGWGIGIIAHAVSAFGFWGLWGKRWEEQKIKEIIEKEEKKAKRT